MLPFYRYLLQMLLQKTEHFILDSDIVVTGDLTPLFEEDIEIMLWPQLRMA